jgi:regulator of replication initiation timing
MIVHDENLVREHSERLAKLETTLNLLLKETEDMKDILRNIKENIVKLNTERNVIAAIIGAVVGAIAGYFGR